MRLLGRSAAFVTALGAAPVALPLLAMRPGWRRGLRERLGGAEENGPAPTRGSIWVHGASVGEILAAVRLLDHLRAAGRTVCASTWTWNGREVLARTRPDVPRRLAPLDHPYAVEAALERVGPSALVLIETELWPSWIAAASRRGIPVVIVSGRLSDRSFPRYRRLRPLLGPTLRRVFAVGARAEDDAARFVSLGAPLSRVRVTGDLKLAPPETAPKLAPDLDVALRHVPVWVAGSTHAGEEAAALDAQAAIERDGLAPALVLAPRHPERSDEVAELVRASGRTLHRRSSLSGRTLAPGEVLLLDGLGDLAAVFRRAAAGFVGGSLVRRGGHNVLEPVHAGCPALFGPHTESARAAAEILLESGAGSRVRNAGELAAAIAAALADPDTARARAEAGRRALDVHRGAVERSAALVEEALAEAKSRA